MLKIATAAAVVWVAVVAPRAPIAVEAPVAAACTPADKCCKVCDEGQACGKTCIAKSKTCHVGRGCACNASEICPAN